MKIEDAITEWADLKIKGIWASALVEQAEEEVDSLWHGGADSEQGRRICKILKVALEVLGGEL